MSEVIIETSGLCKTFVSDGENYNIVKNLSLKIYTGDFTVIMGSSGSGKSTLLHLLSGMDKSTIGEIMLLGCSLNNISQKQVDIIRREKISFVFQGINLIPDLNVYENVAAPTYKMKRDRNELRNEITGLLKRFLLLEHAKKLPSQLSGGQKQRVAICRALINKPKVIFADEPTGALNSSQGQEVLNIFTELNEGGQSIVMVTHDLKAALRANRLLYIKDGRIDGELKLDKYKSELAELREKEVYNFLRDKGW